MPHYLAHQYNYKSISSTPKQYLSEHRIRDMPLVLNTKYCMFTNSGARAYTIVRTGKLGWI